MWQGSVRCTIDSRSFARRGQLHGALSRIVEARRARKEGKMVETEITFNNRATIRVQAQLFTGPTLVSTCVAGPGESRSLPATSARYDIYFKNGATGWEVARKLDSEAKTFTLSQHKGRYTIHEVNEKDSPDLITNSKLTANRSTK